jgi:hypothetical protein
MTAQPTATPRDLFNTKAIGWVCFLKSPIPALDGHFALLFVQKP